ncbi:ABC transporter ATP-binding protein [Sneathiella limimaris]|uniref:ABC transporter ATP-binding protein n=1 Tax=Sneathiella limimaris TaxID=1964213 RepID=UPI00146E17AF|nr:ABC transporter ATP-binding protein [Sneathiella limimaris]
MLLETRDLISGYGEAIILKGLSTQIEKGKITAIMGRNGMGKTTFVKTVMGLLPVSSGSISFRNTQLHKLKTNQIAKLGIGYVPQGREVFEQFTVAENLRLAALGSSLNNLDMLDQIYNWFPILKERLRQKAGTFSGGQQQILAIARALITDPEILLLDEPSEGIQPSIVHEIAETLKMIATETGLTIVMVEQNLDMVRTMADEIQFMENGEIQKTVSSEVFASTPELTHRYLGI